MAAHLDDFDLDSDLLSCLDSEQVDWVTTYRWNVPGSASTTPVPGFARAAWARDPIAADQRFQNFCRSHLGARGVLNVALFGSS